MARPTLLLFAAALAVRVLFWQATPDAGWSHAAAFKGDAAVWLEYAAALQADRPFELGLPFRPPGAAYLIAFLSALGVESVAALKLAWCVLGALLAPLVHASARPFGAVVAGTAGGLTALSTGLMVLSTSLNNETPYLLVAVGSLWLLQRVQASPRPATVGAWSALHAAGCLLRVEHLLFALLSLGWLVLRWRAARTDGGWLRSVLVAAGVFVLALVPWHVQAWSAVRRFNVEEPALGPGERAAMETIERRLSGMAWDADAQARRRELPAFARRTAADFVAATAMHRGGRRVRGEDFRMLEEAFGYVPEPLGAHPFIALYGPLNFALAHGDGAEGGFSRARLEEPPPLRGGRARYPPALVQGLPPPQLSFPYPPHLALVNEGYGVGLAWVRANPGRALRLATRKLRRFWAGAALGYGGFNVPLGLSGVRRAVDLVVPEGAWPATWRVAVLGACLFGAWRRFRRAALAPWLLWLASRAAAAFLFFGYARLGATAIPVVAVLLALAFEPALRRLRRPHLVGYAALSAGVLLEASRLAVGPELWLDGRPVGVHDPFPLDWHADQRLEVR